MKVFQEKQSQQAQAKQCEPLGLARTAWLESLAGVFASDGALLANESMAIVFAIDGACIVMSVRRSYLPHAVTHILKHNELRVRRCAFWDTFDDVIY